ncbi:hypothetical protein EJ110_NYTH52914 [Nymphaea thermarum]|nr:hypothetical protein EJ110_NYTH52914 [Nymphaea thermarum]
MAAFKRIVGASKESLRKIILSDEYEEFPDKEDMHCAAQLAKMLDEFANELRRKYPDEVQLQSNFLVEEMRVLGELKPIRLPNFLPQGAFLSLLREKNEYEEFPDEEDMHYAAQLAKMLDEFANDLRTKYPDEGLLQFNFLVEVMCVLVELKPIRLPNFLPQGAFLSLQREKVRSVSDLPTQYINKVWSYLEAVVLRVFKMHSKSYPQLQISVKRACQSVMNKMRTLSLERLMEMVEIEKIVEYTCNPEYRSFENSSNILASCAAQYEYDEFFDEEDMRCAAQLAKMLDEFANELRRKYPDEVLLQSNFLVEEMRVLVELKPIHEYEEFPDKEDMHCAAQLAKMLDEFVNELRRKYPDEVLLQSNFLVEEMRVLVELKPIRLPNFLPQGAFLSLLREKS